MTSAQRSFIRTAVKTAVAASLAALVGKLLTIQDVCAKLGVHESTFYRRRRRWKFPNPLISEGKFIRWSPQQITTWEFERLTVEKNSIKTTR